MDEEPVLKTGGSQGFGGSIPSSSAKLMESCQSGLSCDFAKVVGVTAPQVRILCSPQIYGADANGRSTPLQGDRLGSIPTDSTIYGCISMARMLVSKTSDGGSSPSTRAKCYCDREARWGSAKPLTQVQILLVAQTFLNNKVFIRKLINYVVKNWIKR